MKALDLYRYTSTSSQDLLLARRVLDGEQELFELLVRPYDAALQKAISVMLRTPEVTEKVVLRTYVRALKTLFRFYGQTTFRAWLLSVAIQEARKQGLVSDAHQWLAPILHKVAKLGAREIAFSLSGNVAEISSQLKSPKKQVADHHKRDRSEKDDYRQNNIIKHIARLLLRAPESEREHSIEKEMSSITNALLEENAKDNTWLSSDIEQEHRENLMLCSHIRMGFLRGIEMHRIRNYTNWYWQTHLATHFRHEEKTIFPVLGKNHELVKKALSQHRRLKRLFESKDDIHKMLSRIEDELLAHVRFEEKVLFDAIKRTGEQRVLDAPPSNGQPVENSWSDPFWR